MDTPLCLKFQLLGTCGGLIPNNSPTATQPLSLPLLNSTENKLERFMVRINAGRALTSYPHCQNRHSWGKPIYCQFKEVWMVEKQRQSNAFHTPPAHFFLFMLSFPAPLPPPWQLQPADKTTPCHSSLLMHSPACVDPGKALMRWKVLGSHKALKVAVGETSRADAVDDVWLSC